jgi:hypothetical protein
VPPQSIVHSNDNGMDNEQTMFTKGLFGSQPQFAKPKFGSHSLVKLSEVFPLSTHLPGERVKTNIPTIIVTRR